MADDRGWKADIQEVQATLRKGPSTVAEAYLAALMVMLPAVKAVKRKYATGAIDKSLYDIHLSIAMELIVRTRIAYRKMISDIERETEITRIIGGTVGEDIDRLEDEISRLDDSKSWTLDYTEQRERRVGELSRARRKLVR